MPLSAYSGALTITTSSTLPAATLSNPYLVTFAASGGSGADYMFSLDSGAFPPGLMLNGATLSGTPPTTAGSPFAPRRF